MRSVSGLTLIELLLAIAAIALIGWGLWWAGSEEVEQAERTSCLSTQQGVLNFEAAWLATVAENPPTGDRILCSQFKAAATAWNQQCSTHFPSFTIPPAC